MALRALFIPTCNAEIGERKSACFFFLNFVIFFSWSTYKNGRTAEDAWGGRGGEEAMIEISLSCFDFPSPEPAGRGGRNIPDILCLFFPAKLPVVRRLFLRISFLFTMIFLVADTFFLVHRLVLPGGGLRLGPHRLRLVNVLAKLLGNRRRKLYVRHDVLTLPKFQMFC